MQGDTFDRADICIVNVSLVVQVVVRHRARYKNDCSFAHNLTYLLRLTREDSYTDILHDQ